MLAFAPSHGRPEWTASTLKRVKECATTGQIHTAACHLLALGDVAGAVLLYRSHGRFRDALALAQQHLLPSDPLYVAVLDGAEAAYFSGSGPYETVAAQAPSAASDAASQATQQAAAAGSGSPATPTMQMLPPQLLAAQFLLAGKPHRAVRCLMQPAGASGRPTDPLTASRICMQLLKHHAPSQGLSRVGAEAATSPGGHGSGERDGEVGSAQQQECCAAGWAAAEACATTSLQQAVQLVLHAPLAAPAAAMPASDSVAATASASQPPKAEVQGQDHGQAAASPGQQQIAPQQTSLPHAVRGSQQLCATLQQLAVFWSGQIECRVSSDEIVSSSACGVASGPGPDGDDGPGHRPHPPSAAVRSGSMVALHCAARAWRSMLSALQASAAWQAEHCESQAAYEAAWPSLTGSSGGGGAHASGSGTGLGGSGAGSIQANGGADDSDEGSLSVPLPPRVRDQLQSELLVAASDAWQQTRAMLTVATGGSTAAVDVMRVWLQDLRSVSACSEAMTPTQQEQLQSTGAVTSKAVVAALLDLMCMSASSDSEPASSDSVPTPSASACRGNTDRDAVADPVADAAARLVQHLAPLHHCMVQDHQAAKHAAAQAHAQARAELEQQQRREAEQAQQQQAAAASSKHYRLARGPDDTGVGGRGGRGTGSPAGFKGRGSGRQQAAGAAAAAAPSAPSVVPPPSTISTTAVGVVPQMAAPGGSMHADDDGDGGDEEGDEKKGSRRRPHDPTADAIAQLPVLQLPPPGAPTQLPPDAARTRRYTYMQLFAVRDRFSGNVSPASAAQRTADVMVASDSAQQQQSLLPTVSDEAAAASSSCWEDACRAAWAALRELPDELLSGAAAVNAQEEEDEFVPQSAPAPASAAVVADLVGGSEALASSTTRRSGAHQQQHMPAWSDDDEEEGEGAAPPPPPPPPPPPHPSPLPPAQSRHGRT